MLPLSGGLSPSTFLCLFPKHPCTVSPFRALLLAVFTHIIISHANFLLGVITFLPHASFPSSLFPSRLTMAIHLLGYALALLTLLALPLSAPGLHSSAWNQHSLLQLLLCPLSGGPSTHWRLSFQQNFPGQGPNSDGSCSRLLVYQNPS